MRLCLNCYRLWPAGSVFCGHCGRSFGGRLCAKHHLSPPTAQVCVYCGRTELTEPASALPLGWALRLVPLGGALLAATWLWRRFGCCLLHELAHAVALALVAGVTLALIPEPVGGPLRRTVKFLLRHLLRAAGALLRLLWGARAGRKG